MIERLSTMSRRAQMFTQAALLTALMVMIPVVYWVSRNFGFWVGTH